MDTISLKLDILPAEILQRIASGGSCEDVLTLSRVNRTLNRVCYSLHVFRSVIQNLNGYGGAEWHHCPLTSADSTAAWARYALADSKARASKKWFSKGSVSYGPQLMVSHHPKLYDENANLLFSLIDHSVGDVDRQVALAFCLAMRHMSSSPPDDASQAVSQDLLGRAYDTRSSPCLPPRQILRRELLGRLSQRLLLSDREHNWWSEGDGMLFTRKYSQAMDAVGIVSILIREALARGIVRNSWAAPSSPGISVPTTESIEFFSLMDMPLPFVADGAAKLPYCHIATMTSKHFLEEGEWAGFYTVSTGAHELHIDWPMRGMRFRVCDDPERSWRHLQAYGNDGIGDFSLSGSMASATGEMTMVKAYTGGTLRWNWTCMMTPFGIVGFWGTNSFGGWLWLWKVQ